MTSVASAAKLLTAALIVSSVAAGCKVETSSEPSTGPGDKGATNIRIEPMSREEVKDAAGAAIDTTADAAQGVKNAAANLGHDAGVAREAVLSSRTPQAGEAPADPATTQPL